MENKMKSHLLNITGILPKIFIPCILIILLHSAGFSQNSFRELESPDLNARSAVLMDYYTGQILYEKNAREPIPPASLTKLMTLHLIYKAIEQGKISKTDLVPISNRAWARRLPRSSSKMFLEPGQKVTVLEIMKGLAVPSGNDAAIAIAEYLAGSVEEFVKMMNREAQEMGFTTLKFTDPSGLSPYNIITAAEFARFSRIYLTKHPESLAELHSLTTFTYPLPKNLPDNRYLRKRNPITQPNNNSCLGEIEGVDGLKTGYIRKSGFNIALTAKRNGSRLIAVILGVRNGRIAHGIKKREEDAETLLDYGFDNFVNLTPKISRLEPVRVWKGKVNRLTLKPAKPMLVTVPKTLASSIRIFLKLKDRITAPVRKGDKIGYLLFSAEDQEVTRIAVHAAQTVPEGSWPKKIWHSILLFFKLLASVF
jgi:D-alanyl-D-alanine carboxypeptidase (penicillin-binding protein 5/6)